MELAPRTLRKVLLIDDSKGARALAAKAIRQIAPQAEIAEADALDAGVALAPKGFDLIIVDPNLPGSAPEESLARLRAAAGEAAVLPCVAHHALPHAPCANLAAGPVLAKPVNAVKLAAKITDL